jgi:hypothetical protein
MTGRKPDKTNRGRKQIGKKQVLLYLTPDEVARLDAVATRNFRSRSGQMLFYIMCGLEKEEK